MYPTPRVPQAPWSSHECLVWPTCHVVWQTRRIVQQTCHTVWQTQPPLQLSLHSAFLGAKNIFFKKWSSIKNRKYFHHFLGGRGSDPEVIKITFWSLPFQKRI